MTIPTVYNGADLGEVAATLGVSVEAVVALHMDAEYTVAFVGFAPGFPYLIPAEAASDPASPPRSAAPSGLRRLLELPRLATPAHRGAHRVGRRGPPGTAGSIRGPHPAAGGCWGRTDVTLFDPNRDPPALLEPGMRVHFVRRDYVSNGPQAGAGLR